MTTECTAPVDPVDAVILSDEEAAERLDAEAREILGISGAEFTRRWQAREYAADDVIEATDIAMLLPGDAW